MNGRMRGEDSGDDMPPAGIVPAMHNGFDLKAQTAEKLPNFLCCIFAHVPHVAQSAYFIVFLENAAAAGDASARKQEAHHPLDRADVRCGQHQPASRFQHPQDILKNCDEIATQMFKNFIADDSVKGVVGEWQGFLFEIAPMDCQPVPLDGFSEALRRNIDAFDSIPTVMERDRQYRRAGAQLENPVICPKVTVDFIEIKGKSMKVGVDIVGKPVPDVFSIRIHGRGS